MKKMSEIRNITYQVLLKYKRARNSDEILYYYVIKEFLRRKGVNIDKMLFRDVMLNSQQLPKFETVSRCRRYLRERHPEIKGSADTERARYLKAHNYTNLTKYEMD